MSFQEQMLQMAKAVLRDTGESVAYTPQGGAPRTIYAHRVADVDPVFYSGTSEIDYDVCEISIYSGDDANGVIAPKVTARNGGAGDTFTFSAGAPAGTWYVKKIVTDGRGNGGLHRLVCANTAAQLFDG